MTSSNYLGAMTVEAAGVELTIYQQYLLNLREEVPAFGARNSTSTERAVRRRTI